MSKVCTRRLRRCHDGRFCVCGRCDYVAENYSKCLCDEGWDGSMCHLRCNLTCHNGGRCKIRRGYEYCNCGGADTDYKERLCEQRITKATVPVTVPGPTIIVTDDSHVATPVTVGVSVGTVLLVVTLFVVFIASLWRKRSLFLMKLVHKFKTYDDNDERPYDAFISYKCSSKDMGSSDDELFLINKLLPKLEKDFGFRVCVHFRDFLPGRSISDNVLAAVEGSHRTIMLISQEYVESVWSRFEYEQAQLAVIQQKQRIIPVLMTHRDELTISDPTLKLILASTTYLEIPDRLDTEEFWVRLRLAMPKKRSKKALPNDTIDV